MIDYTNTHLYFAFHLSGSNLLMQDFRDIFSFEWDHDV